MSIEHKAITAFKWATAAKLVTQAVSWAGTLAVVRLLTPEDYGLMAKVSVVCAIAGATAELGLEAAIVRWVDITRGELRKIYGVSLLFALSITIAIIAAAPFFAWLFHEPRLRWPIAAAALQIIISVAAIIPSALLTRSLSFRRIAKIEMAAGVVSIAVTLLLALLGARVWALVLGTLSGTITRSAALLALGERVWPLFSMRGIGEHLKFGLTLVGNRLSYFIVIQSDVLIGSRFLTTTEIGRYAVALQLATLPMTKVMGTINQITMPTVAQQQDDLSNMRQSVLKSIGIVSLVAFAVLWGISAVAPELVRVLFGPKWLQAVPALVILPLIVPIRMICGVIFTTSLTLGNRRLDLRNTILNLVLLPLGFYVGAHWGLVGLCSAWLVSVPLAYSFSLSTALRLTGIRALDLLSKCGPPAIAAAVMYGAVSALRLAIAGQPAGVALFVLISAGALVYFAVIALISQYHLVTALRFARLLFAREAPKAA